ncbi:HEPN domain-containing protein [Nostoc sp.]|uniref:HEPN domain-containing protein n=1 Tax=Nostoc sp. TaxID=1180 RepID=UPI002FFA0AD4
MLKETGVDRLYKEFKTLIEYIEQGNEISLRNTVDENFRKALLLSAASYFEHRITNDILEYMGEISNKNELLVSFVNNKAISRQYHTYFSWKDTNANSFFGLFGDIFSNFIKQEVRNSEQLSSSIKAFLEIGRERNRLVHQDFGTFSLEKTSDEIYLLYKDALVFVNALPDKLRQCLQKTEAEKIGTEK